MAEMRSHDVVSPHGTRNDPYYWLRDDTRTDKAVLAYLTAENDYTAKLLAPAKATEATLFAEMRGRIAEDDSTVPALDDGYWYYTRFETGKQYPIYARKKTKLTESEQILLDGNELAKGHSFYSIANYDVTRDGRYLAYTEDTVGRRQFTLRVKDLQTGTLLPDTATGVNGPVQWSNDGKSWQYVRNFEGKTVMEGNRNIRDTWMQTFQPVTARYVRYIIVAFRKHPFVINRHDLHESIWHVGIKIVKDSLRHG